MSVRTIRRLAHGNHAVDPLVHAVRTVSDRGFNGTDYTTYCGVSTSGEKWGAPQYEPVTCVACLGTPKVCAWCQDLLVAPQFPSDTPERCEFCSP